MASYTPHHLQLLNVNAFKPTFLEKKRESTFDSWWWSKHPQSLVCSKCCIPHLLLCFQGHHQQTTSIFIGKMLMSSMLSKIDLFMVSQFPCFVQVWSKNSPLKEMLSMLNLSSKSKTCQTLIQPLQVVQIVN